MATILVVDDSTSLRSMVKFSLQQEGYTVVEAGNGQEGLTRARSGQFDMVLTDVNMPIMDGITFCAELRKIPAFKFTPVLVLTTESSPEMKSRGKAAGATGWLVKPFNPDKLISTVRRVIR